MGSYDEVRGRICRDLGSLSIFFDLREAAFEHSSPRIEAKLHVGVLGSIWAPVKIGFALAP